MLCAANLASPGELPALRGGLQGKDWGSACILSGRDVPTMRTAMCRVTHSLTGPSDSRESLDGSQRQGVWRCIGSS